MQAEFSTQFINYYKCEKSFIFFWKLWYFFSGFFD